MTHTLDSASITAIPMIILKKIPRLSKVDHQTDQIKLCIPDVGAAISSATVAYMWPP